MKNISDRRRNLLASPPCLSICIIVVCSFISAYGMSFLGDDLNHGLRTHAKFPNWYQWPLAIPYQWLTGNSRFGDMIGNVLLAEAPMWLLASLSGLMEGLLYFMATKISFPDKRAVLPRLAVIALIMFAFPWWDSFFLFVCRINYIWTAALTLLILWLTLFRQGNVLSPQWAWLWAPVALLAGWGHEAAGMPIVAGLAIYFLFIRKFKSLPLFNRIVIVSFTLGSLLSITSPRSYSRLGADTIPDDSLPILILKSSFFVIAMLLVVALCLSFKSGKIRLRLLSKSPWIVLAIGAVCSMLFVAVGGVVGRSGLFSQTYSLIAIAMLIRGIAGGSRITATSVTGSVISILLFVIMAAHEIGVCYYQIKGNREMKECLDLYKESLDGIVFASPMQRNQFPWWTLQKNKACVDNDDFWYIEVYDMNIGKGSKHYRLLPSALKDFNDSRLPVTLDTQGGYVTDKLPGKPDGNNILRHNGRQFTVVEFSSKGGQNLFYVSPRIIDPGDR